MILCWTNQWISQRCRGISSIFLIFIISIPAGITIYDRADSIAQSSFEGGSPVTEHKIEHNRFAVLPILSDLELNKMRGGFNISGLEIDFAATIQTLIDGTLILESVAKLSNSFQLSQTRYTSAEPISLGGQKTDKNTGALISPSFALSSKLAGSSCIMFKDAKGMTAVIHRIDRNQILNVLINNSDDRSINHTIDINVTIPNFSQFQQSMRKALLTHRLVNALEGK